MLRASRHGRRWLWAALVAVACAPRANAPSARGGRTENAAEPKPAEACHAAIRALFVDLPEPVRATAYAARGRAEWKQFELALEQLRKLAGGHFEFRMLDSLDPATLASARADGQEIEHGPEGRILSGIVFRFGKASGKILAVAADQSLPFGVVDKVREVIDDGSGRVHHVGAVTGKHELGFGDPNLIPHEAGTPPSVLSILTQAFSYYRIDAVDLRGGGRAIDAGLPGVFVTQPADAYTREELGALDDFLMLGDKTLVVYASAVSLDPHDASLGARLGRHGLDALLRGYGVEMHEDALLDFGAPLRVAVALPDGRVAQIAHPAVIEVSAPEGRLDRTFLPFRLETLTFPFSSSLELAPAQQPTDVKAWVVARTTPMAGAETGANVSLAFRPDWAPPVATSSRPLAIVVEGRLKSAFSKRRAPTPSRLLVVSSSSFPANPFVFAGDPAGASEGADQLRGLAHAYARDHITDMILSIKLTLDWMTAGPLRACLAPPRGVGDSGLSGVSAERGPTQSFAGVAAPAAAWVPNHGTGRE